MNDSRAERRIQKCRDYATSRGGQCLSVACTSWHHDRLRWQCAHGHTWESTAHAVMDGGDKWCPECGRKNQGGKYERRQKTAVADLAARGLVADNIDAFVNCRTPLQLRCTCGHQFVDTMLLLRKRVWWCKACGANR